ncbi:unnamed protein product [Caretta caretta]
MPSSVHGPLVRERSTELQLLELCRVSLSRDSCSGRRPVPAQMCVTDAWEPSELQCQPAQCSQSRSRCQIFFLLLFGLDERHL